MINENQTPNSNNSEIETDTASLYVEQLLEILSEETYSHHEMMEDACSLIDDYRAELSAQNTEKNLADNLSQFIPGDGDDIDIEIDPNRIRPVVGLNAGALLDEARKIYLAKVGLTDAEYTALEASDKLKHRPGMTEVYNNLVKNSVAKQTTQTYSQGPFRRIPTEGVSEGDDGGNNVARDTWYREQVTDLNFKLDMIKDEIEDLHEQNSVPQLSAAIRNRNLIRIRDLETEQSDLEKQLNNYQNKVV